MKTNNFKTIGLSLFVIAAFAPNGETVAQQKGDRVVVSADVFTKIHKERVGKVFSGQIDTITEVQGKWCALSRSKGWLPLQYVMHLDMAEKHFTNRIKKNKGDYDAWATRGMIRFEKDQHKNALNDMNESIKLNQRNPVTFNNRGIILNAQRQYPEALANLNQAIKLRSDYADAYENRGLVLVAMGQYPEAIKNFDSAIKERDTNPWSFVNRGTAKSNHGDYKGAKADFLKALKLNKKISDAYVGLSIVYLAESDLKKAFSFANEALKKKPSQWIGI